MIKKEYTIKTIEYSSEAEMSNQDSELIKMAKNAAKNAYAPYSEFKVGACVLLENGKLITGNNQENSAYPSGLCAERVAIFYANSVFPDIAVKAIAICAINKNGLLKNPVSPCGACRQVMLETELRFNKPIRTILIGKEKIIAIDNISQLLPLHFSKNNLKQQ